MTEYPDNSTIFPEDETRIVFKKDQLYTLNIGYYSDCKNVFVGCANRDISVAELKRIQFVDPESKSIAEIVSCLVERKLLKPIECIDIRIDSYRFGGWPFREIHRDITTIKLVHDKGYPYGSKYPNFDGQDEAPNDKDLPNKE